MNHDECVKSPKDTDYKREMLALIQNEMDEAKKKVQIDEFGDFRCSRYGIKTTNGDSPTPLSREDEAR